LGSPITAKKSLFSFGGRGASDGFQVTSTVEPWTDEGSAAAEAAWPSEEEIELAAGIRCRQPSKHHVATVAQHRSPAETGQWEFVELPRRSNRLGWMGIISSGGLLLAVCLKDSVTRWPVWTTVPDRHDDPD